MSGIDVYEHPFKKGVRGLLAKHFHDSILKNFEFTLESEVYNDSNPNIKKQKQDNKLVMEVYYRRPSGLVEYVCDVSSWWSKQQVEVHLLKHITDKARVGLIGMDWTADDKGKISQAIQSGKYETPDSEITKYQLPDKMEKGGK